MKRDEVFESLAPPPGGLARLRGRLDGARVVPLTSRRRVAAGRLLPIAAALAVAALALVVLRRPRALDLTVAARERGVSAFALGLAPLPAAPVTLGSEQRATAALAEVPTGDAKVAFYWVSSTAWQEP